VCSRSDLRSKSLRHTPQRFAEVLEQVPAIGDLEGGRRSIGGTFNVEVGPVAADDFHTRMRPQPAGKALGRSLGQQINRSMTLEVTQNGAVPLAATKGPIINPQYTGRA
jgi:hypothetical protein